MDSQKGEGCIALNFSKSAFIFLGFYCLTNIFSLWNKCKMLASPFPKLVELLLWI
jgi:hypothetical protein